MNNPFENLPLRSELKSNLHQLGFEQLTPIQQQTLLPILNGKDVFAQAKTGSGKTAAFGLGLLNQLRDEEMQIQSLILCPTRELAEQVATQLRSLARMMRNIKVVTVTGGVAAIHQKKSLEYGAHIVVGTPGRVLQFLSDQLMDLSSIRTLVLDEADRMLDMGFYDSIMKIDSFLPANKQKLLFSATYPTLIAQMAQDFLNQAVTIKVDAEHRPASIEQYFYEIDSLEQKPQALLKVLGKFSPDRCLIFCKTKQATEEVASLLNKNSIYAKALHGDLEQNERTNVLTKFTNHSLNALDPYLDVAARGLDIEQLPMVINFDLPSDSEVYVHRIGRTGRAGQSGLAASLILKKEYYKLEYISQQPKQNIKVESIQNLEDAPAYHLLPPMQTMYLSGGKKDKLRPADILGALVKEAGLSADDVGKINVLNILSFVAIKREVFQQAIQRLSQGKIKNRKFKVGPA